MAENDTNQPLANENSKQYVDAMIHETPRSDTIET